MHLECITLGIIGPSSWVGSLPQPVGLSPRTGPGLETSEVLFTYLEVAQSFQALRTYFTLKDFCVKNFVTSVDIVESEILLDLLLPPLFCVWFTREVTFGGSPLEKVSFHSTPKGNAKECSNYCIFALISCEQGNAQNPSIWDSTVCELRTSRGTIWV